MVLQSWWVKDYLVTNLDGHWACTCSLKYNRNYGKSFCKHITEKQNEIKAESNVNRV